MKNETVKFQEKTFDTGEILLNYAEGGRPGTPLVLLHGLTGRWQNWLPFLSLLSAEWHFYAVDLRGHGKSEHPASGYLLPDYVGDVAAFLSQNFSTPVILMGHSLGAVTALFTAAKVPERVRALLLLEPPLFNFHTPIQGTPFLGYFSWVYETIKSASSYEELREQIKKSGLADANAVQSMVDTLHCLAPETALAAVDDTIFAGSDLVQALQSLRCPALFLQGERSLGAAMWDEDADIVRIHSPRAQVIRVSGIGHGFDEVWGTVLLNLRSLLRM